MSVWKTGYNVGLMHGAKKVISGGKRTVSSDWAYTEVFNKVDSFYCLGLHRTNSMQELFILYRRREKT